MSFIDPVKIGNMALSNIGITTVIESFDENNVEAKQIKLWYDFARQQCLSALDWNFARKRITLSTSADDAPLDEWLFRYDYPTDALVVRRLVNPVSKSDDAVPFIIENNVAGSAKTILTDLEEAKAVYTFDLTDTALFTPIFVNAFSFLLAQYIAFPLTNKQTLVDKNIQKYYVTLRIAQATNTNEKVDVAPRDADWIRGRA